MVKKKKNETILYTEYIKRYLENDPWETHNAEKNFILTDAHLPIFTLRRIRRILVAHGRRKRGTGRGGEKQEKCGDTFHTEGEGQWSKWRLFTYPIEKLIRRYVDGTIGWDEVAYEKRWKQWRRARKSLAVGLKA